MRINKAIAILLALLFVGNATPLLAPLLEFAHGHSHQITTEIAADSVKMVFHHHHQGGETHSDGKTDSAHEDHFLVASDHVTIVSDSSPTITSSSAKLIKVDRVFIETAVTAIINEEFSTDASKIPRVKVHGTSASAKSVRTIVLLI